jgi:hypothetical protein
MGNYYKVFDKKANFRMDLEATAATEQRKQAAAVNKNRAWDGGEMLPKGTVCLLKISEGEKNSVGLKGFASCNDRIELLQSIREHQV